MAAKPGAGAAGKENGRKQLTLKEIEFITDRIDAEISSQLNYGREWGELVPTAPKNVDEAIAEKRRELEEMRAKAKSLPGTEAMLHASLTHQAALDVVVRPSPETGLGPADLKSMTQKSIHGSTTTTKAAHSSTQHGKK